MWRVNIGWPDPLHPIPFRRADGQAEAPPKRLTRPTPLADRGEESTRPEGVRTEERRSDA
jgi:hypothetical protein